MLAKKDFRSPASESSRYVFWGNNLGYFRDLLDSQNRTGSGKCLYLFVEEVSLLEIYIRIQRS